MEVLDLSSLSDSDSFLCHIKWNLWSKHFVMYRVLQCLLLLNTLKQWLPTYYLFFTYVHLRIISPNSIADGWLWWLCLPSIRSRVFDSTSMNTKILFLFLGDNAGICIINTNEQPVIYFFVNIIKTCTFINIVFTTS